MALNARTPSVNFDRIEEIPAARHPSGGKSALRLVHPGQKLAVVPTLKDPEICADALRAHGPMSYGMAIVRLGWGGTRAGQADAALKQAGRIAFDSAGRAYLVSEKKKDQ